VSGPPDLLEVPVPVHTGSASPARSIGRRRRTRGAAALLALALGLLTACGEDEPDTESAPTSSTSESSEPSASTSSPAESSPSESAPAGQTQTLAVDSVDFGYELPDGSLSAGTYEITLTNTGSATHDLVVELDGEDVGKSEQIGPGETSTFEVTLEEGEYVFYCSVGNHRQMGMEVPVTVTT
jgi:plastocyanin